MKQQLEALLRQALEHLQRTGQVPVGVTVPVTVIAARRLHHGNFSSSLALQLASALNRQHSAEPGSGPASSALDTRGCGRELPGSLPGELPGRQSGEQPSKQSGKLALALANDLVAAMPADELVAEVVVAPPGFINIRLVPGSTLGRVLTEGERYGHSPASAAGQPEPVTYLPPAGAGGFRVSDARGLAWSRCLTKLLAASGQSVAGQRIAVLSARDATPDCIERQMNAMPGAEAGALETLVLGPTRVMCSQASGTLAATDPLGHLYDRVDVQAVRYASVLQQASQPWMLDIRHIDRPALDNPYYRVRYAGARIASLLRQLVTRGWQSDVADALAGSSSGDDEVVLTAPQEVVLLERISRWPESVTCSAATRDPCRVTSDLRDLADALHIYYRMNTVLVDDRRRRLARLRLSLAVRQVLCNGLALLDVSSPEVM